MGFLPLLPSCGKNGKRMNYGIFATFAIMWQKDELWDFATFAIMWQKWQKDELWEFCHFCHHVAKMAKG